MKVMLLVEKLFALHDRICRWMPTVRVTLNERKRKRFFHLVEILLVLGSQSWKYKRHPINIELPEQ